MFIILQEAIVSAGESGWRGVQVYILRLHELEVLTGTLTAEQVAVFRNLLHDGSVDSIALLEGLLGRCPLANQARDEGRGAGFLVGLADTVESVGTGNGTDGHVQAALFIEAIVSCWSWVKAFSGLGRGGELTPKPSFTGS